MTARLAAWVLPATSPVATALLSVALGLLALLVAGAHLGALPMIPAPAWDVTYGLIGWCVAAVALLRARVPGREQAAWLCCGLGILAFVLGDTYWTVRSYFDENIPVPSPADVGYLAFYPCMFAAVLLLLRARVAGQTRLVWLDGLIAALVVGSGALQWVFDPIRNASEGSGLTLGVSLAYPLADIALFGVAILTLAVVGRRADGSWLLLAAGFAIFAVADAVYGYQVARDAYAGGTLLDAGWPAGLTLMAAAAWQEPAPHADVSEPGRLQWLIPGSFGTVAAVMVVGPAIVGERVVAAAGALALLAFLAVLARLVLTITEHRRLLLAARRAALRDALTGLPNRVLLDDRLGHCLARQQRTGAPCGVLFIDLDRFKLVNDSLSHRAGDALLQEVAARLRHLLRPTDTIARMGGDEFAVVCEDIEGRGEASQIARRLLRALESPFEVNGRDVVVTASIGVVVNVNPFTDSTALLRDADIAMYQSKAAGGARFTIFQAGMRMSVVDRIDREARLRRAIERDELEVFFQPQVRLGDERVVGYEALLRWRDGERGLLPPGEFIQVAEESGLIVEIGEFVLEECCRLKSKLGLPQRLSINVSARQLEDPDLVENCARLVRIFEIDPASITMEITESAVMSDLDGAYITLAGLRAAGVRISIDDFGVGYSSLEHLRRLPEIDELKIDSRFVQRIDSSAKDSAIVASVISLAHALGAQVVAEGVESYGQTVALKALGCDLAQGFLFGKPLPARRIPGLGGRAVSVE